MPSVCILHLPTSPFPLISFRHKINESSNDHVRYCMQTADSSHHECYLDGRRERGGRAACKAFQVRFMRVVWIFHTDSVFDRPDYSNNLLTILVGPECTEFVIHRATICQHSAYFKATCSRLWKSGSKRVIRLAEVSVETFQVYAHWAYTGCLDESLMSEPKQPPGEPEITTSSYWNLGKVWIFASSSGNHALCNCVVDHILERLEAIPNETIDGLSLRYLFNSMPKGSKIRQLLLDMMAASVDGEWIEKWGNDAPFAVILDLAKRYAEKVSAGMSGPTFADRCVYHLHDKGEAKCV